MREIVYSLDEDNDGAADPWELHDWIVWVEKIVHRHVLNEQWEDLGGNNQSAKTLSWGDYQVSLISIPPSSQDTGFETFGVMESRLDFPIRYYLLLFSKPTH